MLLCLKSEMNKTSFTNVSFFDQMFPMFIRDLYFRAIINLLKQNISAKYSSYYMNGVILMKKTLSLLLIIALCLCLFSGCSGQKADPAFLHSYMLNSRDRNEPSDAEITETLRSSDALFAIMTLKGETDTVQTVYVWKNISDGAHV